MKKGKISSGVPERGRPGVNPGGRGEPLLPESEREFLANRRRLEESSRRSLRLAMILLVVLAAVFLVTWLIGAQG